jgi:hypothetical protein
MGYGIGKEIPGETITESEATNFQGRGLYLVRHNGLDILCHVHYPVRNDAAIGTPPC